MAAKKKASKVKAKAKLKAKRVVKKAVAEPAGEPNGATVGRQPGRQPGQVSVMEISTFRMSPETRAHLKGYADRVKITQGELLRRFIAALPNRSDKLTSNVTVPIGH